MAWYTYGQLVQPQAVETPPQPPPVDPLQYAPNTYQNLTTPRAFGSRMMSKDTAPVDPDFEAAEERLRNFRPGQPLGGDPALREENQAEQAQLFQQTVPPATLQRSRDVLAQTQRDAAEFQTHAKAYNNIALLDAIERADQQRANNAEVQQRQQDLTSQGFTEFEGQNSAPGSLFVRNEGPSTDSAFGHSYTPARGGGTASAAPMGDRAFARDQAGRDIEDANMTYGVRVAQARAEDPFGVQPYLAKQGYLQSRKQAIDANFFEAKQRLDQALATKAIQPEVYQSTLENLQYERRFQHEEVDPKGGFERLTANTFP